MRLKNLTISYSTWPKPEHYEGSIEYKDEIGGSKIELRLTDNQITGIFPVVADMLVAVSRQAAEILTSAILAEKEKEGTDGNAD